MITLSDAADPLEKYSIKDGFIVGGITEHGHRHTWTGVYQGMQRITPEWSALNSARTQNQNERIIYIAKYR